MSIEMIVLVVGMAIGVVLVFTARVVTQRVKAQEAAALWELQHAGEVITYEQLRHRDHLVAQAAKNPTLRVFADSYFVGEQSAKPSLQFVDTYYGGYGGASYYQDGGITYR